MKRLYIYFWYQKGYIFLDIVNISSSIAYTVYYFKLLVFSLKKCIL